MFEMHVFHMKKNILKMFFFTFISNVFHIFNYIIIDFKLVAGNGHDNLSLGEVHIELVSLESRNTGGQFVE